MAGVSYVETEDDGRFIVTDVTEDGKIVTVFPLTGQGKAKTLKVKKRFHFDSLEDLNSFTGIEALNRIPIFSAIEKAKK